MLVFMDPYPEKGHSIHFVPDEDAIRIDREAANQFYRKVDDPQDTRTDAQCLADFQTVHWADTIEATIEKMAKEMFCATYKVGAEKWENTGAEQGAAQESWRVKAKAALKSLGVPL